MGEGPKDLIRSDERRDPRLRNERTGAPAGEPVTGRPLAGLDRPGTSEAVGYAGGNAPAVTGLSSASSTDETSGIRADIEQTRAKISDTVDAIGERLSPGNFVAQAADSVKDATRESVRRVSDASRVAAARVADTTLRASARAKDVARENPWAAAAAVGGVAALSWWLSSRRSSDDEVEVFDDDSDILDDMHEERLYDEDLADEGRSNRSRRVAGGAVPLVLAGAGLGWWLWNRESTRDRGIGTWHESEEFGADAGSFRSFEHDRDRMDAGEVGRRVKKVVSSAASSAASRARNLAASTADRAREVASSAASRARGAADEAGHRARGLMADAGTRARHAASDVGVRSRRYAHRARAGVGRAGRRAGSQVSHWMDTNPLAVGAAVMAIGAAVGMALPESRREHRLMGNARDRLVNRAQTAAGDAVDRASQTARHIGSRAGEAMREERMPAPLDAGARPGDSGLGKHPR